MTVRDHAIDGLKGVATPDPELVAGVVQFAGMRIVREIKKSFMRWIVWLVMAIFVFGMCFSRCGGDGNLIDTVATPIDATVKSIRIADGYYNKKVQLKTRVFYRANGNERAWLGKRQADNKFEAFVDEVEASAAYGFSPDDYHIADLQSAVIALYDNRKRTAADISALDIRITASFFLFTTHLLEGRIRYPGAREFYWVRGMPLENDIVLLMKLESAADLKKEVAALQPDDPQYSKLQDALQTYRERQPRDTLKIARIILNLERLRWYPRVKGEGNEIVINVPEFMLRAYHNGKEQMKMRVVLGSDYTPTPVFHDTLKYIVFSPRWIVPKSIFQTEFIPKLQDDPAHFDREKFQFFEDGNEVDPGEVDWKDKKLDTSRYHAVEKPWDGNALGKVKFIMPNDFSVYLHDTPAGQHFAQKNRALSHGCIRLEHPAALAAWLLDDRDDWNEEKILKAMNAGKPQQVNLDKPYPVYIVYHTVIVDDDGRVLFLPDIYGHDKRQLAVLR